MQFPVDLKLGKRAPFWWNFIKNSARWLYGRIRRKDFVISKRFSNDSCSLAVLLYVEDT